VTLLPIVYFFGPDGAGKTTLVRHVATMLRERRYRVKVSWMRGSHTLASLLLKLFAKRRLFTGSENPYYAVSIPPRLRPVWQVLELLSALPVILYRFVLPSLLGYWVLADRYALDLLVWIVLVTQDPRFLRSLSARLLTSMAMRPVVRVYVTASLAALKRRVDAEWYSAEQVRLYDRLSRRVDAYRYDTTARPEGAVHEIVRSIEAIAK
jgi:thymidylate kinase